MNQIIKKRAEEHLFYVCAIATPLWLIWIAFDYIFANELYLIFLPLRILGSILSALILVSLKKRWFPISITQITMFLYYNLSVGYMIITVDKSVLDIYFNGYSMIIIVMFFILILDWKSLTSFVLITTLSFLAVLKYSNYGVIDILGNGGFVFLTLFFIMIAFGILRYKGVMRDASLTAEIEKAREIQELNINLENANKEKETLLKEIHHRVKNNLQVISSILSLQNNYVKDLSTVDILKESISRIKSMSIIHETLYKSENFASINFSDYLYNLAKDIITAYKSSPDLELNIKKDLSVLYLDIHQAIPCGLIVNELITNAVKYAFINQTKGEILLAVKKVEQMVVIEIGDNGCGLPKNFKIEEVASLGLQLVQTLVDQLDGTICVNKEGNTLFQITFPHLS